MESCLFAYGRIKEVDGLPFPWRVTTLLLTLACAMALVESSFVQSYITAVKEQQEASVFFSKDEADQWKERIKKEAPLHYIPPMDARIDPIWKAIPGLNGREVDIEKSLAATMKAKKRNQIVWVYREIPPHKKLKDLGNAPIYRGNEKKKAVALMVNVAWGTEHLPDMLQIFKQENVKVTFFVDGSWLKKNPDVAKKLVQEGHEIGNHAYSHPLMSQVSRVRMQQEIGKTQELIQETLNVKAQWFAPPAGDYNQLVCETAGQFGMKTVLWTVDTVDWRKSVSPQMMIAKVQKELGPGHLLLTHPTDRTVKALPEILKIGRDKGLQWMTVGEVLSESRSESQSNLTD